MLRRKYFLLNLEYISGLIIESNKNKKVVWDEHDEAQLKVRSNGLLVQFRYEEYLVIKNIFVILPPRRGISFKIAHLTVDVKRVENIEIITCIIRKLCWRFIFCTNSETSRYQFSNKSIRKKIIYWIWKQYWIWIFANNKYVKMCNLRKCQY